MADKFDLQIVTNRENSLTVPSRTRESLIARGRRDASNLTIRISDIGLLNQDGAEQESNLEVQDSEAQFQIGMKHFLGNGVKRCHVQAAAWFSKAAKQKHSMAQSLLGGIYESGEAPHKMGNNSQIDCEGIPQDYIQAAFWYQNGADGGHSGSSFKLGEFYEQGRGIKQDYIQAAFWYQKAAEQGDQNWRAQFRIGCMYRDGIGVHQDNAQAAMWLRKAADLLDYEAQFALGMLYAEGRGVQKDYAEALFWLQLSSRWSVPFGEDRRKATNAQIPIAAKLTRNQQEVVLERVRAFNEAHRKRS
jgi:TPR repeat protein